MKRIILAALGFVLMAGTASAAEPIKGKALALDGDTILLTKADGTEVKIRLWAVDAPEMKVWPWGQWARMQLDTIIDGAPLECKPKGESRERVVAQCFRLPTPHISRRIDVGHYLIRLGVAVEYRTFGKGVYAEAELKAQKAKMGVWKDNPGPPPNFFLD